MKRVEIVVLAVVAALAQSGCFTSWVASQAAGNAKIWDESVREQAVPMPGFTEHLVVSMPLVIEMTPAPATTSTTPAKPPTPLPFALQCRAQQQGHDAVYHSAFRYGKSWKKGTAIMFLLEGLSAAALYVGSSDDDDVSNRVLGAVLAVDAVGSGVLFFAPRKDIYRRDEKPVTTVIREDCPETLTLQIGGDVFPIDAIGRLGELGDLALDDWMQAPTGSILVGLEGRSFELVITSADRCTWNRHRQRTADPGCASATGISQQYATTTIDVTPGTLTRVIE